MHQHHREVRVDEIRRDQIYLSTLLTGKIWSPEKRSLGRIVDLQIDLDPPQPEVIGIIFRQSWSKGRSRLPWNFVSEVSVGGVTVKQDADIRPFVPFEREISSQILIKEFLLDKQIVDVHGAKVERVNDLLFVKIDSRLKLFHVDVGLRGLLRRLGYESYFVRFSEWFFDYTPKEKYIAWNYVQPLTDPDRLRLQIPQSKLADLHPADLADIMEDLDVHERAAVVQSLDEETIADVMEEMDPKIQVSIIRGLEPEKAADILEEMSPDEAADLLQDLPSDTVQGIFREMDADSRRTIRDLLEHEEDEAGGLMTSEFISMPPDKTIVDALALIRQQADQIDVIYYIYITDSESRILGVTNLRELLSNEIFTPLERIMTSRVIAAKIDDEAAELVDLFMKYGFRAIPVVDEDDRIKGVIRLKALLELVAPHLGK
jgi:CBS domain-containing protein